MSPGEQALRCREGAGLFRLRDRGLVRVEGADRVRWLDGMLTNDVARLAPGRERSGCHALLLTRIGRIVADLHVLLVDDAFWLETEAAAVAPLLATLAKFVIADDVRLADAGAGWERLALEGPAASGVFAAAAGEAPGLAPDCADAFAIAGTPVRAGAWGVSGEDALQLFVPAGRGEAVCEALRRGGARHGLLEADADALEILRIEAGTPRYGRELGEAVLPAEAGMLHAISTSKGCYTGQEIVARTQYRGILKKRMALAHVDGAIPAPGQSVYSPVFGDQSAGTIANVAPAPEGGYDVLVVAQIEGLREGDLRLGAPDGAPLAIRSHPPLDTARP
jgi:folate-binding protein YgfZ